uniref:Uncharacterized protein n=1 Tax=Lotus japonicus TaxID=34305 RepID=I3SVZ6_LOTJA|nr:unknown [Lotus japonicus]
MLVSLANPLIDVKDLIRSSNITSAFNFTESLFPSKDAAFFTTNRNVHTSTPVLAWKATKEFLSCGTQSLAADVKSC